MQCAACRFSSTAYTDDDVAAAFRDGAEEWRRSLWNVSTRDLHRRPRPDMWSVLEYIRHCRQVAKVWTLVMNEGLTRDLPVFNQSISHGTEDTARTDRELDLELRYLTTALQDLATTWERARTASNREVVVNSIHADLAGCARHVAHELWHHISDGAAVLELLGQGVALQQGHIQYLHVSDGGVPKVSVVSAETGYRGLAGDRQRFRKHHGRVTQAVSLWSSEVISSLQTEGHPVQPGWAGENLTVTGLEWASLRTGVRLAVGIDGPLLELTGWADPCKKIADCFLDRDFRRIDASHPAEIRYYAKVLRDGTITTGDSICIVPR